MKLLSRVRLFATPWTVAHQAPLSMGFSRQEYWSGLPFPSPEDLPNPGIEPRSPALQADALTSELPGKPTRPFRYDLNQIPYHYTVEVINRFKGLDLIERLMNYRRRFMTLYRRQKSRPSPRKRNAKKQNGCLRRPYTPTPGCAVIRETGMQLLDSWNSLSASTLQTALPSILLDRRRNPEY